MAIDLETLAPLLGNHAYLASGLHDIEAKWSADEPDPEFRVHLARFARYHAWHAELWAELLPDSVELEDRIAVESPDKHWSGIIEQLAAADTTALRLALLYGSVLPRLTSATRCLLGEFSPIADAAALRDGGFVVADLAAEMASGWQFLHGLAPGDELARALDAAAAAGMLLAASGFGRCGA